MRVPKSGWNLVLEELEIVGWALYVTRSKVRVGPGAWHRYIVTLSEELDVRGFNGVRL